MTQAEAPKPPPLWKRAWTAISTLDTAKDVVRWLATLAGGSMGITAENATARFGAYTIEWFFALMAAFCFGAIAGLAAIHVAFWAAPRIARAWRKRFCKPPLLAVKPLGGRIAVLEIENSGGTATLIPWARIIEGGWDSKHRASYPLLWKPHWQEVMVAAPQGTVSRPGEPPLLLWIAGHELLAAISPPATILAIYGGPGKVDAIHIDPKHGSPAIKIEVTIFSDPPPATPFVRTYLAQIQPNYQRTVEFTEAS